MRWRGRGGAIEGGVTGPVLVYYMCWKGGERIPDKYRGDKNAQ